MEPQLDMDAEREFDRALAAIAAENTVTALAHLERALKLWDNPGWHSYLGFCVAKERGQYKRGLDLCQTALALEQDNPVHYLNLGKVHLLAGNKVEALRVLREGVAKGGGAEFMAKLDEIGTRKPPVISGLSRNHPLNRYLGLLFSRIGLRRPA